MLVLVPQTLCDSLYGSNKHALKIVSRIVCDQIDECRDFRSSVKLKGKPSDPANIFTGWINLDSVALKSIASGYHPICMNLERDGFIQKNPHYSNFPGKRFPYSYRLHSNCWNDRLTLCRVQQRLSKKKFHCVVGKSGGRLNEQYLAAERHLEAFSLPEDLAAHLDAICEQSSWPDLQRQHVARLYQSSWWSKVDSFGRYHTPLTSLSKGIRNSLRCNGKEIVGLDFANFQPALLALLSKAGFPERERKNYFTLCKKGQIYEYMADRCPLYSSRKEAKMGFLTMLNMKNAVMRNMPMFSAFEESFPTYAHLIQRVKKDDHRDMARFLQRTEAEIVFGGVVRSFKTKSDSPFFTVHDAIYTTRSEKDLMRSIIQEVIDQWGIPTAVEEENHSSSPLSFPSPINVGMNRDRSGLLHPSGLM
jgi:hypothetical protein